MRNHEFSVLARASTGLQVELMRKLIEAGALTKSEVVEAIDDARQAVARTTRAMAVMEALDDIKQDTRKPDDGSPSSPERAAA